MHYLHLVQIYHPAPSGAARYFQELGARLVAEGHRVTVLASDAFDLEHFWAPGRRRVAEVQGEQRGVRIVRFPVERAPGPPLVYPIVRRLMVEFGRTGRASSPALRRLARLTPRMPTLERYLATAPDLADVALVHTTNITLDFAILPLVAWARARALPHICTPFVHLGEPGNDQIVRYYSMPHQIGLLRDSTRVATMTGLERDFLQTKGVPAARIRTVGCGVTEAEHIGGDGARFRREHDISGPIVLSVGAAAYDKGTIHMLEAMQQLWRRNLTATWVQIGPQLDHFVRFYTALPAADKARTRVLGVVDDRTRRDALAAADIFAMPSRTDSFGIVYLEAWCNGVPVIGAQAGGVPDVVSHGSNGLLVPFGAIDALAAAIERLLRDRTLARALGEVGQRTVAHSLSWDHVYGKLRALYEEVGSGKWEVGSGK